MKSFWYSSRGGAILAVGLVALTSIACRTTKNIPEGIPGDIAPGSVATPSRSIPRKSFHDEIGALGLLHCQSRGVSLASSNDNEIQYWLDGEEHTPGCNWHLKHFECQSSGCLYRCKETEAFWLLSRSGDEVKMEKRVRGSTLPQTYLFSIFSTRH